MRSIQEVFVHPQFATAHSAVVQKLRPDQHNLDAMHLDYTESWPGVMGEPDLIVLSLGEDRAKVRTIYAGFLMSVEPSALFPDLFRIYADNFIEVGEHDLQEVGDADFYGKGRGGGSRKNITRRDRTQIPSTQTGSGVPPGMNERRLAWVRKNHRYFRDPVYRSWQGRCAVHDHECGGLLVASHILPWHKCTGEQKTDVQNGLLLSAPLDRLFDRGWISFDKQGLMLVSPDLDAATRRVFGIKNGMKLQISTIETRMQKYLEMHREEFGFS